ncbi:HAMP domain-containing histidine kinase [Crossiella sp. SN42]|uniref:sensor histidine kinase n=1 Tax=Crossiella sp. SN42 TaxID=2944808 RepID=UPI00207C95B4|nr:HAMP domain-containing sensor histidine kinase [Crossiella sp. SN42]MCO1576889.1 HAMP domain-containing histidine kinase [Crossiella sp. SN42]
MIRQLVASYVMLVAVAIAAFTVPVAFTLTTQLEEDLEQTVRREADTVALLLTGQDEPSRQALDRLVRAYQQQTPGRIELLPADSPEARGAGTTRWTHSPVFDADALVLTVPAHRPDGTVVGAVRFSYPEEPLNRRLWQIWGFRAALAVGVLIVAAAVGVLFARRLTRPLRELTAMAARFSDGDLTARSAETGPPETRALARTLNSGAQRLGTLVDAQRAFVADASHQLRTPLTALRLSLDNIGEEVTDELTREDVDTATAEVVRMSRLVNGLLALAKAEGQVAAPEPVAVGELVRDRFEIWSPVAAERGLRLLADLPEAETHALAAPGHLEQVLDNVLSNAIEVSPDGGTVTVRATTEADRVTLVVLDEGPGLSEPEQARAFDRFWRGQGLTGRGGSGLGLAIVKQLVADAAGTVRLAAAPSGGLAVWITLRATSPAVPRSGAQG